MSDRKCVNCRHNKRILRQTYIETRCEIDNHYIDYNECFTGWCRHWAKDHTFDEEKEREAMAGCASCLHKNVHPNVCSDCLGGTHFKPRNKTNADCIRQMTDEELAKFLTKKMYARIAGDWKKWLDWLRQEAE